MFIRRTPGPVSVQLPDGTRLTRADLPPPDTGRWVASRKRVVVLAVRHGLLSAEEACSLYDLSNEELEGWCVADERHGIRALRTTHLKRYRQ